MSDPAKTDSRHGEQPMGGGARAFVRTLGIFFTGLKYLIILIFAAAFFQGVFFVREHEEAMLFHFGRLVRKGADQTGILTSGRLYWAWPHPVDEVQRIPARRPVTLTTEHFWPKENPNAIDPGNAEIVGEGLDGLEPGQGGYALTGDTNVIHMKWSLVYTVRDARKYYLEFFSGTVKRTDSEGKTTLAEENIAEKLILNCLEHAVLAEVASWSVEDVLYKARTAADGPSGTAGKRELLTAAVQDRVVGLLEELDLGVEVLQIMMTPRPPDATLGAFREVNDAANEYRTALEQARSYEQRVVAEAEGRASEILAEAESYKTRVVASVEADAAYFSTVLDEYRKNPRTMLVALYADTVREVLGKVGERYVLRAGNENREVRLMLNRAPEKPGMQSLEPAD